MKRRYAQLQIAMAHYRQMEKPDRDHAEAVQAEAEFQTFLEKYPNSPLVPQAEQHLRDVQEVLAEGNFRVASFYYTRAGVQSLRRPPDRIDESLSALQPGGPSQLDARADL